jgi:hypothetical protein
MPTFTPTLHQSTKIGMPWATWYVSVPTQDNHGVIVKEADGSFAWAPSLEEALKKYPSDCVYEIGRGGYYLTLTEVRQAVDVDGIHGIAYVDDYNDEWTDYYVVGSSPRINDPGVEVTQAEPVR